MTNDQAIKCTVRPYRRDSYEIINSCILTHFSIRNTKYESLCNVMYQRKEKSWACLALYVLNITVYIQTTMSMLDPVTTLHCTITNYMNLITKTMIDTEVELEEQIKIGDEYNRGLRSRHRIKSWKDTCNKNK